jgi:hypothetical protein
MGCAVGVENFLRGGGSDACPRISFAFRPDAPVMHVRYSGGCGQKQAQSPERLRQQMTHSSHTRPRLFATHIAAVPPISLETLSWFDGLS